jgi:hypothetical protein
VDRLNVIVVMGGMSGGDGGASKKTPTLLDGRDLAEAKSYLASLPARGRVTTEASA